MASASSPNVKADARRLIDALPDDTTWDEIMYRISVRLRTDAGIRDAEAGNVVPVEEVRRRFGLQS